MGSKSPPGEGSRLYFEAQSYWGLTKHLGGIKATRELIELCHISKGKYILDVGCGVGATVCYIAKRQGCKAVGVDISERMIERAMRRAEREGVEKEVEFQVADAQALPFDESVFDIVICESVTAFLEDKEKAISECVRVTKPGGYIGLNEGTWMRPPPRELVEYMSRITGVKKMLTSEGWRELLESSGLKDVVARTHKLHALSHLDEIRLYGLNDFLSGWYKFLHLCITDAAFRRYMKEAWPGWAITKNFLKYLGYGIYVGRK